MVQLEIKGYNLTEDNSDLFGNVVERIHNVSIKENKEKENDGIKTYSFETIFTNKDGYTFMRIRSAIFPIVNVATSISYWIILLGFLFELLDLIYIGIALTCLGLLFQIVTLPVEFDASKRAGVFLKEYNLATEDESKGVKKMLGAAAMTYVAGVLASALQILRLILAARNND